jgi:hypothetical protein
MIPENRSKAVEDTFLTTIKHFINQKPDLKTGKTYLLKYLEKTCPEYDLRDLRSINFHSAQDEFEQWLLQITEDNTIPSEIQSLWFGLAIWNYADMQEITQIGMIGSKETPVSNKEWACYVHYRPNSPIRYLEIFEVVSLSINQYKQWSEYEEYNELESIVFLSVTCLLLANALPNISDLLLLNQSKFYVGFGYNSGDQWELVCLTTEGWK